MKFDGIIFDMDGTLWDTAEKVCLAWNESFAMDGVDRRIDVDELSGYLGLPMHEIAERMFEGKKYAEIKQIFDNCMERENRYLVEHGGGILYPRLVETLAKLAEMVPLYIVSNCQSGYIEAFYEAHGTQKYFKDHECYGTAGKLKAENIRIIVERNHIERPVYVGDTAGDMAACREAGVPFIYAAYGFGTVENPDYRIDTFSEMLEVIK